MKTTLTTTLFILITTSALFGQRTALFDHHEKLVTVASEAYYVRQVGSIEDTIFVVADSYTSGQRKYVGLTHEPDLALEEFNYPKEGEYFTYNDSNKVVKLELYSQGKKQGDQYSFKEDGSISAWSYYKDDQVYYHSLYYDSGAIEDSISYDYSQEKVRMQRLCYHRNGQPERIELLEDDELIESTCYNDKGEEKAYVPYEEMPEFPGGVEGLQKYLAKALRYPNAAQKRGIQGRVYVQFVVDVNGRVENVKILRSVHPDLDEESLRVVNKMPDWKPGKRKGISVRVSYTVPLAFKLT
jgi:TonB family protein